ncbi:MAG: diguanylate cyclase [Candidatus Aminicenantes bacterium]|nr:MAG: diguanylate cyclase [Candidatus Aminicenantes bacterium]
MKILIVEDDVTFCESIKKDIVDWGYEAISANNGKEAWQLIENEDVRLAILDTKISDIDGFELCRKIRRDIQEKKIKNNYIILLIDEGRKDDIAKGLSMGADDYLTRPFDFFELKVRIQNGERIIKLEDSCKRLATYDPLTKLLNRNKILEFLSDELNRGWRHNHPTGVIMADIDHFKKFNDTYGHSTGDAILVHVALRIKKTIRPYDKAGRYGGDEVLIVLPNCSQDNLKRVAERLRRALSETKIKTKAGTHNITLSLGGASSEISPDVSANDLIQSSDNALLLAKRKGRNWAVFAKTLHDSFNDASP